MWIGLTSNFEKASSFWVMKYSCWILFGHAGSCGMSDKGWLFFKYRIGDGEYVSSWFGHWDKAAEIIEMINFE